MSLALAKLGWGLDTAVDGDRSYVGRRYTHGHLDPVTRVQCAEEEDGDAVCSICGYKPGCWEHACLLRIPAPMAPCNESAWMGSEACFLLS